MTRPRRLAGSLMALLLALPAAAQDLPPLQRGDIIFQTSRSAQSQAILLATGSPFTHVGIVDFDATGAPVVLEAVRTTRATPLGDWIAQGVGGDVALYRLDGLTEDQARAVSREARRHFGKGYDPYFHQSENTLYCSELVHIAYRDSIGLTLGQTQTFADLTLGSRAARALIAERWQSHPACTAGRAQDAEDCLTRLLAEPIITPAAVAEDPRLRLVFSSIAP